MERERITISIKKRLLDAIDKTIDGINVRNRSHAIETLATKVLDLTSTKNAVILLGGENAIKSIPSVKDNLNILSNNGFNKVYIAVGYLSDQVKEKLGDGSQHNLEIEYLEKGEGSGGTILPLKKMFKKTFFVINDVKLQDLDDLDKMLDFHNSVDTSATIVAKNLDRFTGLYIFEPEVFDYIPRGFSMIETDIIPKLISNKKLIIKPII